MDNYVKKAKKRRDCSLLFATTAVLACLGAFICSPNNAPSPIIVMVCGIVLFFSTAINIKIAKNPTQRTCEFMFFPLFINFILLSLALVPIAPNSLLLVWVIFTAQICLFSV